MNNESEEKQQPTKRDMETVLIIGVFLVFFALATLMGPVMEEIGFRGKVVNTVAGLVLMGFGLGALYWAYSMKKRIK